jgi:hypothetical protein
MQRIDIEHDFALPVERVYAYLPEHENLSSCSARRSRGFATGTPSATAPDRCGR